MPSKLKNYLRHTGLYNMYKSARGKYAQMQYGNLSKDMFVIGVTGTNGKTTSSFIIHHIFNTLIDKTFLMGTNEIKFGAESFTNTTKMTSPDVMTVYKHLSEARKRGCQIAVLEVASHGIDQQRYYGIDFDMAVLTNITAEHLDYHKTMEDYANTKKKLFLNVQRNPKNNKSMVLPKDDKIARERADDFSIKKIVTFGISSSAALKAENIEYAIDYTSFQVNYMGKTYTIRIPMLGIVNVYNTLTALSAGIAVGLSIPDMVKSFESFIPPHGRMEAITHNNTHYFVDFAHTPDGLEKTLQYLQTLKIKNPGSKILLLTGAMGERDRYKRPEMGKIANRYADIIILADEDPGDEPRFQIINDIKKGINRDDGDNFYIIPDRSDAIHFITQISQPGDFVLLAGKGHETVMSVPGGKKPWNEKKILENYLNK